MSASRTADPALPAGVREAIQRLGYAETPEIVRALATAVERGHHVAALAADGSGREALYAMAVAGRCDPALPALQALVLSPTPESAERVALAVRAAGGPSGPGVRTLSPREDRPHDPDAPPPQVLAALPGPVLERVRAGRLRLGDLRLLIVDGAAAIEDLDGWESAEAILDTLPEEAQRIVVADRREGRLDDLLIRQLPRARRWPPELFEPAAGEGSGERPVLRVGAAASDAGRLDLLEVAVREALERGGGRFLLRAGPGEEIDRLAAVLEVRLGEPPRRTGDGLEGGAAGAPATAILFGTPLGLDPFRAAFEGAERRVAVLHASHLRQLELLAARCGWTVRALAAWSAGAALEGIHAFRRRLEGRIRAAGTDAELLVLEPLLEEHGAERVAAALSALLRRRDAADPGAVRPWPDAEAASGVQPAAGAPPPPERGTRPAWTRIWIGVGRRDQARPSDVVGAITGETGIVGGQIGRVEIRGSYSLVDVDSQVVENVVRKLGGAVIRGRTVTARLDRGD